MMVILIASCSDFRIPVTVAEQPVAEGEPIVTCMDLATVSFEGGFREDTVALLLNGELFSEQVLSSDPVLGFAGIQRIPLVVGMEMQLTINERQTEVFRWPEGWCQVRIGYHEGSVSAVFTNRVLVYF